MLNKIFSDILKNQKRMMAIVAVTILLSLFLYASFILKPQIVKIAETGGKSAKIKADLKSAKSDIANMEKMKSAVEEYGVKIGKYEKTLPVEEGIPSLLESLSEMAEHSNMSIVGIVPVEPKDLSPQSRVYKEIPIMISARSGFHELGRFVASLESSDRFIKIADIRIKSGRSTPKKHDIELLVVTYVLGGG